MVMGKSVGGEQRCLLLVCSGAGWLAGSAHPHQVSSVSSCPRLVFAAALASLPACRWIWPSYALLRAKSSLWNKDLFKTPLTHVSWANRKVCKAGTEREEREQVSWCNDHAGPGPCGRAAELLWWPHSSAGPEETGKSWEQSRGRGRAESSSHHGQPAVPGSAFGIASTSCCESTQVSEGRGTTVPPSAEPRQPQGSILTNTAHAGIQRSFSLLLKP